MYSFEIIDIICILGVIQGLFLAIALQTIANKNKSANRTLSILLFITAFFLFCRTGFFRSTNQLLLKITFPANTFMFIFGSLIYTYIRRLTFEESKKYKLPLFHYIPAISYFISILYIFFILQKNVTQVLYKLISIQILPIILNIFYLFKSYQLINLYQKKEKNNLSYNQNVVLFIRGFIISISIIVFFWFLAVCFAFFKHEISFVIYKIVWALMLFTIYLIGYNCLRLAEVFKVKKKSKNENLKNQRLDDTSVHTLQEELEFFMNDEKIYLDSELTLPDLAKRLNTSSNNLSWLLNSVYKCTFYEYVNRFRIKTFINKIENGEHKECTLLALSIDSGFNSKSTFYKAFKAEMDDTPTNYIKNLS